MTTPSERTQAILEARSLLLAMARTPRNYFGYRHAKKMELKIKAVLEHLPGAEDFCPRPYMTLCQRDKAKRPDVSPKLFDARVALAWIDARGSEFGA